MCGAMWCEGEVFYLPLLKSSTANHSSVLQTPSAYMWHVNLLLCLKWMVCHDLRHICVVKLFDPWKVRKLIPLLGWKVRMETTCVCLTFLPLSDPACARFVTWLPCAVKDYLVCLWNYEIVKQLHTTHISSDVSISLFSAPLISSGFLPRKCKSRSAAHMYTPTMQLMSTGQLARRIFV